MKLTELNVQPHDLDQQMFGEPPEQNRHMKHIGLLRGADKLPFQEIEKILNPSDSAFCPFFQSSIKISTRPNFNKEGFHFDLVPFLSRRVTRTTSAMVQTRTRPKPIDEDTTEKLIFGTITGDNV